MSLPSSHTISRRAASLAGSARLIDSVLDSALGVLMPLLRAHFGLSYSAISALRSVQAYTEAAAEPLGGMVLDVWPRRWILGSTAIASGIGSIAIGAAPGIVVLGVGFALVGGASGPLRQAGDVVAIEFQSHLGTSVLAKITMLSPIGALAGPLLVSAWVGLGLEWATLQVVLGLGMVAYGVAMLGTEFPPPPVVRDQATSFVRVMRENLRVVMADRPTVSWLVFMRVFYVMDTPAAFETLWLADRGGMATAGIGIYVAFEMCVAACGNFVLGRWLGNVSPRQIVLYASLAMLLLFPAWFLVPGTPARYLIGAPLAFAWSMIWPVARAESLRGTDRPGAVSAVNSLTGLYLPVTLAAGLLADAVGLTQAMLSFRMVGAAGLVVLAWRWLPGSR